VTVIAPVSRGKQRGLALLFLLILIGLAGAFFLVNTMNKSGAALSLARDQKTQAALDLAKQALLTFVATTYAERAMDIVSTPYPPPGYAHDPNKGVPGYFPCPDSPSSLAEGYAAGTCGSSSVSTIGKFPWYTLDIEPLRDGSGECLWYAVSGTYKFSPNGVTTNTSTSNMMNWDTPGLFDVLAADGSTFLAGNSPSARAVAVIFAPGPPLPGQDRSNAGGANCRGNYTASNYLETASGVNNSAVSAVANAVTQFIAGQASNTFNDRLVYITREEVWTAIKKLPDSSGIYPSLLQAKLNTLTQKVAQCIAQYGTQNGTPSLDPNDKRLPWTTVMSLSNYAVDSQYADNAGTKSGHVSYNVSNSKTATNNSINPPSLFAATSYCKVSGTMNDSDINWYSNWKDHLFYALSNRFRPDTGSPTLPCDPGSCVKVNGSLTLNAAVVMFTGERLAGQMRDSDSDRANITNYLEGRNASNHPNSGYGDYQSGAPSATFNDLLYCISQDLLSVAPCP